MSEGVTTLEIKSGYGLELNAERRLLTVARELGRRLPLAVRTTYLGLHALPQEYHADRAGSSRGMRPWLEALAGEGLVDAVDAFCENIAFTLAETEQLLRARRPWVCPRTCTPGSSRTWARPSSRARYQPCRRITGVLSDGGARALAAAARLRCSCRARISCFGNRTHPPYVSCGRWASDGRATDCNPGSSPCTSILLTLNMACTLFGLTPLEGVERGHVPRGAGARTSSGGRYARSRKRADFALYQIDRPAELCYNLGANPV